MKSAKQYYIIVKLLERNLAPSKSKASNFIRYQGTTKYFITT